MKLQSLTVVLLLCGVNVAIAAPSSCGAHSHLVTATIVRPGANKPSNIQVTVVMDHQDPLSWYYFPNSPTIGYRNGKPQFSLLKYQLQNPGAEAAGLVQGGIVTGAVRMGLEGIGDQLRSHIAVRLANANDAVTKTLLKQRGLSRANVTKERIAVSLMPFDKFEVIGIGIPGEELLVKEAHVPDGVGPAYGTESVPITLELTRLGLPAYKSLLIDANAGIPVMYSASFTGVTPEIGFTVHVNWEKTYEHFSSHVNHRTSMARNLFGADVEAAAGTSNKAIINSLQEIGAIEVTQIVGGDAYPDVHISNYLDPLLEHIYANLFEDNYGGLASNNVRLTEEMEAAALEKEATTLRDLREPAGVDEHVNPKIVPCFKTEVSMATLSKQNVRSLQADVGFRGRSFRRHTAMLTGVIGIGGYKAGIRGRTQMLRQEGLLILVGDDNWDAARFHLPKIDSNLTSMRIERIDIETSVLNENGRPVSVGGGTIRSARFDTDRGWIGRNVVKGAIAWPLMSVARRAGKERFSKYRYGVRASITSKFDRRPIVFGYELPLELGQSTLASPLRHLQVLVIDASRMMLEEDDELEVIIKTAGREMDPRSRSSTRIVKRSIRLRFPIKNEDDELDDDIQTVPVLLPPSWTPTGLKPRSSYTFSANAYFDEDEEEFEWTETAFRQNTIVLRRHAPDWKESAGF